ncbi:hypothetical protein [Oenococcus sp.]|uniref:hypothetical protein n=1 Tax=Oenococcus sp. TaxID=1979414 RepID=UPI0039E72D4D
MTDKFLTIKLIVFPIVLALLIVQFNFSKLNFWSSIAAVFAVIIITMIYSFFSQLPTEKTAIIIYSLILGYIIPAALIFLNSNNNLTLSSYVLVFLACFPAVVSIFNVLLSHRIIMHNSPANAEEVESLRRDLIMFSTAYVISFFAVAGAVLFAFLPWTTLLLVAALPPVFNNVIKFISRPFILATANLAMRNYWMMAIAMLLGLTFGILIRR